MTKLIKRITVAAVVLMALIGAGGVVAFASGYITWGGTKDYNEAMANLDSIREKGQIVVKNLDEAKATILVLDSDNKAKQKQIDALEETVTKKDQLIADKDETIATKEAVIAERDATIVKNTQDIDDLTKQVNEGNDFKNKLVAGVTKYIKEINQEKGKGPRYDKIAAIVNENGHFIGVTEKLDTNPAGGPTSNQLDQAIEDMGKVNEKTESVLEIFKGVEVTDTEDNK